MNSVKSILLNTNEPYHLSIIDNSHGGLDEQLKNFENNENITIFRNHENLGKGRGVMKWYDKIMSKSTNDYFISIDGDICVYKNWLERLVSARNKISVPFAILAPIIMNKFGDWFTIQQKNGFIMHNTQMLRHFVDEIYYNRYTAGPLYLIDRKFFERSGGYSTNQLYGSDDGKLCRKAYDKGMFIGLASNVHVLHLRQDDTPSYIEWKKANVNKDEDHKGYWD